MTELCSSKVHTVECLPSADIVRQWNHQGYAEIIVWWDHSAGFMEWIFQECDLLQEKQIRSLHMSLLLSHMFIFCMCAPSEDSCHYTLIIDLPNLGLLVSKTVSIFFYYVHRLRFCSGPRNRVTQILNWTVCKLKYNNWLTKIEPHTQRLT